MMLVRLLRPTVEGKVTTTEEPEGNGLVTVKVRTQVS
jgi:hypothetical protein